jgi:hypothetical protein
MNSKKLRPLVYIKSALFSRKKTKRVIAFIYLIFMVCVSVFLFYFLKIRFFNYK